MAHFDLCLTWYWEYDQDFVRLLESACRERGLTILHATPETVVTVLPGLESGQVSFSVHFDRTVHDTPYEAIFRWSKEHNVYRINPQEAAAWAEDKATMHLELINAGIYTPYTIILPPFDEQNNLPPIDLSPLGERFVIKPCYGGGGEGVIMDATSLEQILRARTEFPELKYLLQEQIYAQNLEQHEAWFRIIFCDGQIYPCWWHPRTHVYTSVSTDEETRFGLAPLRELTTRIAALCKLDFFSTEIVLSNAGQWIAVDYVNDQIDLRLQSQAADGVPDALVEKIAADLAELVRRKGTVHQ
jgi:hypothetical protein